MLFQQCSVNCDRIVGVCLNHLEDRLRIVIYLNPLCDAVSEHLRRHFRILQEHSSVVGLSVQGELFVLLGSELESLHFLLKRAAVVSEEVVLSAHALAHPLEVTSLLQRLGELLDQFFYVFSGYGPNIEYWFRLLPFRLDNVHWLFRVC